MKSELTSKVWIQSIPLPAHTAATVRKSRLRQGKRDCIIIFPVFTLIGFGVVGIGEFLFFGKIPAVYVLGLALASGILAALGVLVLNFVDWPMVRKDLETGTCEEAIVNCERATRVRFNDSDLEGVALDCNADVLVLLGDWWLNSGKTDIWDDPSSQKRFPAKRFRIRYLRRSGIVLLVEVLGEPLNVDDDELNQPVVKLDFFKYAEILHVPQSYDSLIPNTIA